MTNKERLISVSNEKITPRNHTEVWLRNKRTREFFIRYSTCSLSKEEFSFQSGWRLFMTSRTVIFTYLCGSLWSRQVQKTEAGLENNLLQWILFTENSITCMTSKLLTFIVPNQWNLCNECRLVLYLAIFFQCPVLFIIYCPRRPWKCALDTFKYHSC